METSAHAGDDRASGVSDEQGILYDAATNRRRFVSNASSIFVPVVGVIIAVLGPLALRTTAVTWLVFVLCFFGTVLGVVVGLHRYFTHGSFKTSRAIHLVLGVLASWALQGPISLWVGDHRRHHKYADRPGDPHSPYWYGARRFSSRVGGLFHAHVLWMLRPGVTDLNRYAPDLLKDSWTRRLSNGYGLLAASSLLFPALVGLAIAGPQEALRCLLWAGCTRVFVLQQFTWTVNSWGHMFGTHEPAGRDESRDNGWVFLILGGDGLHNYHHRHPYTGVNAPVYLDPLGMMLLLADRLGLVWDVRRVK